VTKLRISPNLSLPEEAVTEAFAILAKRGVGKTYTGSVMVEEMLKARLQVAVVDPLGVWWGLRSSSDGKQAGFPILILGGQHGDVPLDAGEASGKLIADLLVEERLSAVLDLSLFSKEEMRTLVTAFAERLFRAKATRPDPLHLMVDEADMFLPQRYSAGPAMRMVGAFNDLVLKGRVRGLGSTLITQRSAKINKDVLTQVEILLAMRITHPRDRVPIEEWVKEHGDEEGWKRMLASLHQLPVGTAWVWWGTEHLLKEIRVRKRTTFDSSATPKVGQRTAPPKTVADVDLAALEKKMAATVAKAKADDPKELRRQIAELQKQLRARPADVQVQEVEKEVRVEVPIFRDGEVDRLLKAAGQLSDVGAQLVAVGRDVAEAADNIGASVTAAQKVPALPPRPVAPPKRERAPVARAAPPRPLPPPSSDGDFQLAPAEKRILMAVAPYPEGRSKNQIGIMAGIGVNKSTLRNGLSKLRTAGLVEGPSDSVRITQAGLDFLGDAFEPLPTGSELLDYWLASTELALAERAMLQAIAEADGHPLSKHEVGDRAGYDPEKSTVRNGLSKLRTLGLIAGPSSAIRIHEDLRA
jgi:hypothetical protein